MLYQAKFTLTKKHYTECFEQSASIKPKTWRRFSKAAIMFVLGIIFYASQIDRVSNHLGQFFFILAFIDVLSVVYARGWWVARQMMSKASGSQVNIELDQDGISINSDYIKQQFLWNEVSAFIETEKGMILTINNVGQHYLSKRHFSEDGWQYLIAKLSA